MIGQMDIPAAFRYKAVFLKGKPMHPEFDSFRIKHPAMDISRRAKIFAPFDALRGFGELLSSAREEAEPHAQMPDSRRDPLLPPGGG